MYKKILLIISIILVIGALVFSLWIFGSLLRPVGGGDQAVAFKVESGQSVVEIANNLRGKDLINNQLPFIIYIRLEKKLIRTGDYELSQNLSPKSIADILAGGQVKTFKVTIPEGYRIEQIGQKLENEKIISASAFIAAAKGHEGFLFPDTYEFKANVSAGEIVAKMTETFLKRTLGLNINNDTVVLASIIEREAKFDADRAKIAGVFTNRLDNNMKLEADPTVAYAKDTITYDKLSVKDQKSFEFWGKVEFFQYLKIDSKSNTYIYAGLPPTAICNPGLKSIQAALNPEKNDFFYFLQTTDGTTYYSHTVAEHEANKEKYLR